MDLNTGVVHISKTLSPTSIAGVSFDFSIGSGPVKASIGLHKYAGVGVMWELTESGSAKFRGVSLHIGPGISLPVNLTVEIPKNFPPFAGYP